MRKTFTYFVLLIAFMFAGTMSGWAQFKAEITTDPVEGYTAGNVNFDPAEIAAALETDVETLKSSINAGGAYYIQTADGKSNVYTGNLNEFWMNNEGVPQGYGDEGTTWFCGISWNDAGSDEESGETWSDSVSIHFGQMPNTFKYVYEASVLKTTTYLVVGEKEITFEVIQNINPAPVPTLPAPVTKLSELTIVKDYELVLPFVIGKSYEGKPYTATLDGVYDALGVNQAELDASAFDYVYTQLIHVDSLMLDGIATGEVVYSFADSLAKPSVAAADGWYGRYLNYDETTATEIPLEMNAPMAWNTGHSTFYTGGMTLEEGVYTVYAGQFPGGLVAGDTDYTYHYIIVGDKAVRVKIQVQMVEPVVVPFAEMTSVGKETRTIASLPTSGYESTGLTVNIDSIAALLGCTVDDLNYQALADEATISDNTTAGNYMGYWLNADGYICQWGSGSTLYAEINDTFTTIYIGQYPGVFSYGQTQTIRLFFTYADKYYEFEVVYNIEEPEAVETVNVATEGIYAQIVPGDYYTDGVDMYTQLDIDYIKSLIGEGNHKLYALSAPNDEGVSVMTDSYTCTPHPGFWMSTETKNDGEVYVSGWGGNSFGMTYDYSSGLITWWQIPNLRAVGDSYNATFFLVNTDNGKMITFKTYVEYVETIVKTEVVGEEDLTLVIPASDEPLAVETNIDALTEAYGVDYDLLEAAAVVKILKSAVSYSADNYDSFYGWFVNNEGYSVAIDNDEACMAAPFTLGYEFLDGKLNLFATGGYMAEAPADDVVYRTKVAVEYDAKQYIYNISLMNEATATGIEKVETTTAKAGNVYDLSGRIVTKSATGVNGLAKGIYILNGKKYIVK